MANKPLAIVTGASRGIGKGIAVSLGKAGYDLVINYCSNEKNALETKKTIDALGVRCEIIQADISIAEDRAKLVCFAKENFGCCNLLVNNAGVAPNKRLDILETTPDSYDRVMNINTRGPFFLTQKIANQMKKQVKKHFDIKPIIVFISSISAYVSSPSRAEYCLSKAGVSMAAKIFADRLTKFGINVYEVRPGIIQTDMTAVVKDKYDKLIKQGLIPQDRWGYAEDVGRAVVGLVKGYFNYSTGLAIEVSGGMNIQHL